MTDKLMELLLDLVDHTYPDDDGTMRLLVCSLVDAEIEHIPTVTTTDTPTYTFEAGR
jgi:hypothetical protein